MYSYDFYTNQGNKDADNADAGTTKMNWLDWVLLVTWAAAAVYGLQKKATGMIAALVVLTIGLLFAQGLASILRGRLGFISDNELAQVAVAYILVAIVTFVAAAVLGWLLGRAPGLFPLGGMADRALGLVFGLVIGLLLTAAVLSALMGISPDGVDVFVQSSWLGGFLVGPFNAVVSKLGLALPW